MLNKHPNLADPESDYLRVGECIVDVPRREVSAPQRTVSIRISLKALQVLLVLVAHQGKVVGREALLEWVWPDTLPTDDVLTQAITQLRKAFGDDREAPRYVETIAKGGYRLLAASEWVQDSFPGTSADAMRVVEPASIAVPPKRSVRPRTRVLWMVGGLIVVAAALGMLAVLRFAGIDNGESWTAPGIPGQVPAKLALNSLTSRTGKETGPALSPDGSIVVYADAAEGSSSSAIMMQTTAVAPPRQLTYPGDGESDLQPKWSRDGRLIAFIRVGGKSGCRIITMAATGGDERIVAPCYGGDAQLFDWVPDGSALIMGGTRSPEDDRSPLRLLELATGQWRTLPYLIAAGDVDLEPRYSPDGKWIVFRRNFSLSDLWRVPASGGQPERLTHLRTYIHGWDWMPDASALIVSLVDSRGAALYRYQMRSGRIDMLTEPQPMLAMPDVAANAPVVAFEINRLETGIYRYRVPGAASTNAPDAPTRLFASSGSDLLPAVSPDGRQLAFVSDRSIRTEWWIGTIGEPESLKPVKSVVPVARHAPVWSPDGRKLLVIGFVEGRQRLFEVDVQRLHARWLPVSDGEPSYASYLPGAYRLLVGVTTGEGKTQLRLYDTSGTPWRSLAAIDQTSFARYDAGTDKIYFTRLSQAGLWSVDVQLQHEMLVDPKFPTRDEYKQWDVTPTGIYYTLSSGDCQTGWTRLPMADNRPERCLDRKRVAYSAPDADGTGQWVFVTLSTRDNYDIGWAEIPSTAARK